MLSFLALCGLLACTLAGCIVIPTQEGGDKLYEVTAPTAEGRQYIRDHQIAYLCRDVWGMFFSDIFRSDCHFVQVFKVRGEPVSFAPVDGFTRQLYGFEPEFTSWDRFGCWIAIPLGLLTSLGFLALVGKLLME